MSISKAKRVRRKELKELRSRKCRFHGLALCEWRDCKKQVYEDFYGTGKRKLKHEAPIAADIEALFRLLRQPVQFENSWTDFPDEPKSILQPVSAAPPPVAPAPVIPPVLDPKKMTLRERIELAKSAL